MPKVKLVVTTSLKGRWGRDVIAAHRAVVLPDGEAELKPRHGGTRLHDARQAGSWRGEGVGLVWGPADSDEVAEMVRETPDPVLVVALTAWDADADGVVTVGGAVAKAIAEASEEDARGRMRQVLSIALGSGTHVTMEAGDHEALPGWWVLPSGVSSLRFDADGPSLDQMGYRDLQRAAKDRGLSAAGGAEAIRERILDHDVAEE